jgi:hypothetical protein
MVISTGLPMLTDRSAESTPDDAVDEIADVGKAARLRAVAEHDIPLRRAQDTNAGTARPSLIRMRGP